jgi:hypothetical protein
MILPLSMVNSKTVKIEPRDIHAVHTAQEKKKLEEGKERHKEERKLQERVLRDATLKMRFKDEHARKLQDYEARRVHDTTILVRDIMPIFLRTCRFQAAQRLHWVLQVEHRNEALEYCQKKAWQFVYEAARRGDADGVEKLLRPPSVVPSRCGDCATLQAAQTIKQESKQ